MLRLFVRFCSTKPTKADTKISWNRDNKQLFGSVVKVKKAKKVKTKGNPEISHQPVEIPSKVNEPVLSSEMHWLLGPANNRRRMLTKPYDNTERVVLKIKHPVVDEQDRIKRTSNGFDEILKVPWMITPGQTMDTLHAIPELEYKELPSVGKILQATMSYSARNALIQWKLSKIEELGEEGFQQLQKDNLGRGLRFHNMLQDYFNRSDDESETVVSEGDPNYQVWKSVQSILPEIDQKALFVEQRVQHPVLRYKGVVDCVSTIWYVHTGITSGTYR